MILSWPECRNARDLGGLATLDGRRIGASALLRSDNHDRLTPQGVKAVRASGIGRIVDLRSLWESAKYPSPFANDPLYRNVPLVGEEDHQGETLTQTYRLIIDECRRQVAMAFCTIAEAPPGGVLVHCHSGKDRTGILVALTLKIAGVAADAVAADYALTHGCTPQILLDVLNHVEDRYGGVPAYLRGGGAGSAHVDAVRSRLLAVASGLIPPS